MAERVEKTRSPVRKVLASAAGAALLLTATLTLRPEGVADVRAGRLSFNPARPGAGAVVSVEYEPSGAFGHPDALVLRARYRTPDGEAYNEGLPTATVARLERAPDGTLTGQFSLPDSVVHGAFSVESAGGDTADDNLTRSWTLLVHEEGLPTVEALEQHSFDLMGVSWEDAHAAATNALATHPSSPTILALAQFFERALLGEDQAGRLRQSQRAQVDSLHARVVGSTLPPRELGWMAWLTRGVGHESAPAWAERVGREGEGGRFWALLQVIDHQQRNAEDPAALLDALEAIWGRWRAPHDNVTEAGVRAARASGDPDAILRWSDRAAAREPAEAAGYARALLGHPRLRGHGISRLRELARELLANRPEDRALGETVPQQTRRQQAAADRILARIGLTMVEDGSDAEGLRLLDSVADRAWDLATFRTIVRASERVGDTIAAAEMSARISVDPRTEASVADSLRAAGRARLGATRWADAETRSASLLRERVLQGSARVGLPRSVRLNDREGAGRSLEEMARGRTSVLVFWNRRCGAFLMRLEEIRRVARLLAAAGVQVFWITGERPSPSLDAFIHEKGIGSSVWYDTRGEAKSALNVWGTPSFRVLDADAHVRFSNPAGSSELLLLTRALQAP